MLFERFSEKYNSITTFSNRVEAPSSSEAYFDNASELPKAVSDLAVCSDAIFYNPSCKVLYILVCAEISGPITEEGKTNIEVSLMSEGINKVLISVFSDRYEFSGVADQIAWGN
ncbi:hypothetical protein [Onishia taeanensis]|uniref:hypothetical protein n=1 Tax=Onishia taeanensis TaxID=284577 RepID=UPI0011BDE8B7|nr:hypothetical protein [Halomonas taeanensis]